MKGLPSAVATLLLSVVLAAGDPPAVAGRSSTLAVVEGNVVALGLEPGEGGLELVTVRLAVTDPASREVELLLAPPAVLEETGFAVREGDRLKARIFATDEGRAVVHKVLNQTRGSMLRLRTLRQIPLWNSAGVWQGGPGPGHHGQAGRGPQQPKHGGTRPYH